LAFPKESLIVKIIVNTADVEALKTIGYESIGYSEKCWMISIARASVIRGE
jgi:hypothetical protein